jgi:DNA-binding LacI/PurR family transcriptional regulator/signal transduction histidine kinase
MSARPASPSGLPTVGLLVDWLEDDYQNAVVAGVADGARALGVNLVCFAGGVLGSPHRAATQRNVVYELAGAANVDGLLIMSGSLGNHLGPIELGRYCERYRPLPMCSIAVPLPSIPSVLVDNAAGMRELVAHLLDAHAHRRIAFVRGPEANEEAERRFSAYREVLAERDAPLDPALVVVGDFQRESGERAVAVLLDERGARFEAIVAANDAMALGAIEALRARGKRVPDDVAVVGFDDIEEARFSAPALTTVRQPLHALGRKAVETLCAVIEGREVPANLTLRTEVVARQSCGCAWRFARPTPRGDHAAPAERSAVIAEMTRAARAPGLGSSWAGGVLDALVSEAEGGRGRSCAAVLDEVLRDARLAGADVGAFQDVVSVLREDTLGAFEPAARARAERILDDLRVVAAKGAESAQAQHRLEMDRWARRLSGTSEALVANFDVASLVRAAAAHLPRLGIATCYLSLYEPASPSLETARLVLAHDGASRLGADLLDPVFASRELAPARVLPRRRTTFVLEPVFFRDEQLGFVLLEMGPREGGVYESLREQMSAAIKGALLMQEVVEKDREQQRLLADLEKHARELEVANQAIRDNQSKLVTSEKLASLGRLTASIVHEMNTPLAAVRNALVDLGGLVTEYEKSSGDAEVTAEDHAEIVGEMRQSIGLARSAAERAQLFVRGIKGQTRDLGPHERQTFDVLSVTREALLMLGHSMRKGNCRAELDAPAEPVELFGSPVRFSQVITNLVENAVDATIPRGGGAIHLRMAFHGDNLVLEVEDGGTGIPPDVQPRIFEPMFTTKPFGQGTGLGLSIVRDIVTGHFGGAIDVRSHPDEGTTFTVLFSRRGA